MTKELELSEDLQKLVGGAPYDEGTGGQAILAVHKGARLAGPEGQAICPDGRAIGEDDGQETVQGLWLPKVVQSRHMWEEGEVL